MISIETTTAFFSEMASRSKDSPYALEVVADFARSEPNVIALLTTALSNREVFSSPVATAIFAAAVYEKLRSSQEQSDILKRQVK